MSRVHIRDISELRDDTEDNRRLIREAWAVFNEYLKYVQRPSQDVVAEAKKITDPGLLADCIWPALSWLNLKTGSRLLGLSMRKSVLRPYWGFSAAKSI